MSKIFVLIFSVFLGAIDAKADLNIFACESEWGKLAEALVGEKGEVNIIVHPNQDAHHVSAKPSIISKLDKADLLVCNGANLEMEWLPIVVRNSRNKKIKEGGRGYFLASENIIHISTGSEAVLNPHFHLDPRNMVLVAKGLLERLKKIDKRNIDYYQRNFDLFKNDLERKIIEWEREVSKLHNKNIIVIHGRYDYLIKWLSLNQVVSIQKNHDISPSIKRLKMIRDKYEDKELVAFIAPFDNRVYVKWMGSNLNVIQKEMPYSPLLDQDLLSFYSDLIALILD